MKKYEIKFLEPETEIFLSADTTRFYEAETELEALHQFAEVRKEDLDIEELEIVSEDPFLLRIKGWTEGVDRFEITEDTFEYIASEVKE